MSQAMPALQSSKGASGSARPTTRTAVQNTAANPAQENYAFEALPSKRVSKRYVFLPCAFLSLLFFPLSCSPLPGFVAPPFLPFYHVYLFIGSFFLFPNFLFLSPASFLKHPHLPHPTPSTIPTTDEARLRVDVQG